MKKLWLFFLLLPFSVFSQEGQTRYYIRNDYTRQMDAVYDSRYDQSYNDTDTLFYVDLGCYENLEDGWIQLGNTLYIDTCDAVDSSKWIRIYDHLYPYDDLDSVQFKIGWTDTLVGVSCTDSIISDSTLFSGWVDIDSIDWPDDPLMMYMTLPNSDSRNDLITASPTDVVIGTAYLHADYNTIFPPFEWTGTRDFIIKSYTSNVGPTETTYEISWDDNAIALPGSFDSVWVDSMYLYQYQCVEWVTINDNFEVVGITKLDSIPEYESDSMVVWGPDSLLYRRSVEDAVTGFSYWIREDDHLFMYDGLDTAYVKILRSDTLRHLTSTAAVWGESIDTNYWVGGSFSSGGTDYFKFSWKSPPTGKTEIDVDDGIAYVQKELGGLPHYCISPVSNIDSIKFIDDTMRYYTDAEYGTCGSSWEWERIDFYNYIVEEQVVVDDNLEVTGITILDTVPPDDSDSLLAWREDSTVVYRDANFFLDTTDYDSIHWRKEQGRVFLKDLTDSVGVGTDTPTKKFEVDGDSYFRDKVKIDDGPLAGSGALGINVSPFYPLHVEGEGIMSWFQLEASNDYAQHRWLNNSSGGFYIKLYGTSYSGGYDGEFAQTWQNSFFNSSSSNMIISPTGDGWGLYLGIKNYKKFWINSSGYLFADTIRPLDDLYYPERYRTMVWDTLNQEFLSVPIDSLATAVDTNNYLQGVDGSDLSAVLFDMHGVPDITEDFTQSYYEEELATTKTVFSVGFTLTAGTVVLFNGQAIKSGQWSGIGTSTLTLSLDTRQYDHIYVKQ